MTNTVDGCFKGCVKLGLHDTCQMAIGMPGSLTSPVGTVPKVDLAVKKDDGKYDPTMLSPEMVEAVSKVRMFGAKKYSRGNWKKGFKYTRSLAAALRHLFAFLGGQDNDPESGLSHLAHAICSIEHCLYDTIHHPQNDDRAE